MSAPRAFSRRDPSSPCASTISVVTPCFMSSSRRTPTAYDFPPPVFASTLPCFCAIALMSRKIWIAWPSSRPMYAPCFVSCRRPMTLRMRDSSALWMCSPARNGVRGTWGGARRDRGARPREEVAGVPVADDRHLRADLLLDVHVLPGAEEEGAVEGQVRLSLD